MRGDFEKITYREAIARAQLFNSEKLRKQGFAKLREIKRIFEKFPLICPDFFKKHKISSPEVFMEEFSEIFFRELTKEN